MSGGNPAHFAAYAAPNRPHRQGDRRRSRARSGEFASEPLRAAGRADTKQAVLHDLGLYWAPVGSGGSVHPIN